VVQLERILPERFQGIAQELAKFGTIGVINLVVNFAVFNLLWLTVLRSGEVKAKAVATIVATTCAYFMNRHWTYRDRPKSTLRREYTLFFFFNLVGLFIEVTVVGVAKYGFGQTHIVVLNLCGALGIALGTIFRFWSYRTHVFRPAEPMAEEPTPVAIAAALTPIAVAPLPEIDSSGSGTAEPREHGHTGVLAFEDLQLQDELTQIELDEIVANTESPIRSQ
jgi:putative flippase GtrA